MMQAIPDVSFFLLKWFFEGSFVAVFLSFLNWLLPARIERFNLELRVEVLLGYPVAIILDLVDMLGMALTDAVVALFMAGVGGEGMYIPPLGHTLLPVVPVVVLGALLSLRFGHPGLLRSTVELAIASALGLMASALFQTTPWAIWVLFPLPSSPFYVFEATQLAVLPRIFLPAHEAELEAVLVSCALMFFFVAQVSMSLQARVQGHSLVHKVKTNLAQLKASFQERQKLGARSYPSTRPTSSKKGLGVVLLLLGILIIVLVLGGQ